MFMWFLCYVHCEKDINNTNLSSQLDSLFFKLQALVEKYYFPHLLSFTTFDFSMELNFQNLTPYSFSPFSILYLQKRKFEPTLATPNSQTGAVYLKI